MRVYKSTWSAEEDKFLLENYGKMPTHEIAARLGRTRMQIHGRRQTQKMALIAPQPLIHKPIKRRRRRPNVEYRAVIARPKFFENENVNRMLLTGR